MATAIPVTATRISSTTITTRTLDVARRPGCEIALIDTPGIHRPQYRMNAAMVREATDALETADRILFVVDASERRGPGEEFILERIAEAKTPAILALNKIDLLRRDQLLALAQRFFESHKSLRDAVEMLTPDE